MSEIIGIGRIEASFTTLMRQSSMTAHDWLQQAVTDIDEIFGAGYARAHPELAGHYLTACAIDYGASAIAKCVTSALDDIAAQLSVLSPDLSDMASAVSDVAAAVASLKPDTQ
jgi:hypothetical protein